MDHPADARRATTLSPLSASAPYVPASRLPSAELGLVIQVSLVDLADDRAIIATDSDCRITWVSSGATRLLGWGPEELLGRVLPDGLTHEITAPRDGTSTARTWSVRSKDGRALTLRIDVSELVDERGVVVGFFGVAVDVGEQERLRAALDAAAAREREALARVAELDRTRRDFVDTAGHELRTPLTSIAGFVEILEDSVADLGPEYELILASMRRNCDRLVALADDLSTLCAFDAEPVLAAHGEVDLTWVLREAETVLRERVTDPLIQLDFDLPSAVVRVRGDASQLQRLVLNLLFNSVKFSEGSGVVGCRLVERGDDAVIEVSDQGIGVPVVEQAGIFERFYRGTSSRERHLPGPGLGLALARSIATAHHGEISVESVPGRGATFRVALPRL